MRVDCPVDSEEGSSYATLLIALTFFHFVQSFSFPFVIDKVPKSYWFVNLAITIAALVKIATTDDVKCEPYLRNYTKCDIIISALAYLNGYIEATQGEKVK
jgi:hypothetical protein